MKLDELAARSLLFIGTSLGVAPALRSSGRRALWWWVTAVAIGLCLLPPLGAPMGGAGCSRAGRLLARLVAGARVACELGRGALCDAGQWTLLLGLLVGRQGGATVSRVASSAPQRNWRSWSGWTPGQALGVALALACAVVASAAARGHAKRLTDEDGDPLILWEALANALSALRRLVQVALLRTLAQRLHGGLRALNLRCQMHRSTRELAKLRGSSKEVDIKFGRALRKRYGRLRSAAEAFNVLFGWRILMLFMECFIRVEFNFGIYLKNTEEAELVGLIDAAVLPLGMIIIIISCDMATKEADELLVRVLEMEDELPWGVHKQQLRHLAIYMENHRVQFNALGFFHLNRNTVFSFTNVINTYLIVILQMC